MKALGEDWTDTAAGGETWTDVSSGSEVWTDVDTGSEGAKVEKAVITFGEWAPDQADIMNPGVTVATNVMPSANVGYHSMSSFVLTATPRPARSQGIFAAKDSASNTKLFAGDATKLYLHASSDNDLDSISRPGMIWLTPSAGASFSSGTTSSLLAV